VEKNLLKPTANAAPSLETAADSETVGAYQKILSALLTAVPEAWREATVHAEIVEGSAEFTTVYISKAGDRRQVFIEDHLEPILRSLRTYHWDNGMRWYTIDLRLLPSGQFSASFGYVKTKWMLYKVDRGRTTATH